MKKLRRIRGLVRRLRRRHAAGKNKDPLREFVYLDDVSVYSLVASRLGPIASEFTDAETKTLRGEASVSAEGSVPGLGKAGAGSRILTSLSRESHVVRKSIVQTTFKELYGYERDSLQLKPPASSATPPPVSSLRDFEKKKLRLIEGNWIHDPASLRRGQLVDLEVVLEAESIFKIAALTTAMLDIYDDAQDLFTRSRLSELVQIRQIARVLEQLMVGLVPVRGKASDYSVLAGDEQDWIVRHEILRQLDDTSHSRVKPLFLAGVTDHSLYWKDVRRVLFSDASFRVFARLARDGVHESWNPVKLVDLLKTVVPALGDQIASLSMDALGNLATSRAKAELATDRADKFRRAVSVYQDLIRQRFGLSERRGESDLDESSAVPSELADMRKEFEKIARRMGVNLSDHEARVSVANLRREALREAGLNAQMKSLVTGAGTVYQTPKTRSEGFLDTEFVAVYW